MKTVQPTTVQTNWRDRAACRATTPELFFPIGTGPSAVDQEEQAKTVCRACAVRPNCLAWALEQGVDDGVFGGLNERERELVRRRRRNAQRLRHSSPVGAEPGRGR